MTEPTTPTATCTYCNGKGYNTRCYDEIGSDDFGGEGYTKRGLIEKVPCKKCQKEAPQEMCHCGRVIKGTGEFRHCPVGHYPEAPEAPKWKQGDDGQEDWPTCDRCHEPREHCREVDDEGKLCSWKVCEFCPLPESSLVNDNYALVLKLNACEAENKRMKSALKEIRGETADNPINVYRPPVIIASEALSSLPTL